MAPRYYDIAVNLTDSMFMGSFETGSKARPEWYRILDRAAYFNVEKVMITGSSLEESRKAIQMAVEYEGPVKLYTTVGVHPCTVNEFENDPEGHIEQLRLTIKHGVDSGVLRAIGEIGLDYDRFQHTIKSVQLKYFELQLKLACEFDLPLFLHMRSACDDFIDTIEPFIKGTRPDGLRLKNPRGVVHSFTGEWEEAQRLIQLGFHLGVNGCSLRTSDSMEVVRKIPLEKIMIETDAPWCEVRKTHSSFGLLSEPPNEFYPRTTGLVQQIPQTKKQKVVKLDAFLKVPLVSKMKDLAISPQVATAIGETEWEFGAVVKGRNEPCFVGQIAEAIAKLKGIPSERVIETVYETSCKMFA
ncbi:unnamed protein product [Kuraishia capsulata CBS 1993]|uniref:TatD related DNase n=1 Tax=Kuraishia capsulata CBS 1993 TaxID=1382522 RepID=W6MR72_9ASCO|nr:uncharacterized protein KUCA_T00005209001 [Kuraishia capsulata CBS 1993]CDK29221.1 unnamed protein product [Kuraishia capsulata CBS 1993]